MEESAGPRTRSRARGGAPATGGPTGSAAPSTRKKAAPRSSRKSVPAQTPPVSPPKPASNVPEHADDTAAAVDVPEAPAHTDKAVPTPAETASLEMQSTTPLPSASGAVAGLTPASDSPAAAYGPSPVQPIKLDSLWTPATTQQDANNSSANNAASPYAGFSPLVGGTTSPAQAADGCAGADPSGMTPETSGVDLAAMFISTPAAAAAAAANGSSSPIAGVVADLQDSTAAAAATAAGAGHLQETPSANDSVLMASPALPGAFAFAGVPAAAATPGAASPKALPAAAQQDSSTPVPSAPLLPPAGTPGTPGWSVDTELPPAGSPSLDTLPGSTPAAAVAAGATPGSVRGGLRSAAKRTPGTPAAAKGASTPGAGSSLSPLMDSSPMPAAGPPDMSDTESPLPPASSPMMQEDETETLPPAGSPMPETDDDEPLPPAGSPMPSYAGTPAAAGRSPLAAAAGGSTPAAAAAGEGGDIEMGDSPAAVQQQQHEALEAQILQTVEAEAAVLEQQVQAIPMADCSQEQQQQQGADEDCSMGSDAEGAAATDTAGMELEGPGSPVAASCPAASATPANTPAAAAATNSSPGVTSPGARYRSASAKTSAPPKSALARPRSGPGTSTKHAHVVVPEASSPKTTPPAKTTTGRRAPGSARFTGDKEGGSSPGHTPFPTKAKVKAATAAAGRSGAAAAAAAASKGPSHKKELARAAAESALKRSHRAAEAAAAEEAEDPEAATPSPVVQGPSVRRGSSSCSPGATIPNVSSRLMQPTASSSAKARGSGAADQPDALMWGPPPSDGEGAHAAAPAAAAGSSRPRLASKIVVPSPPQAAAGPTSLKALKRSIKSKVAEKAQATLKEGRADTLGADAVRSSKLAGAGSSKVSHKASRKAAAQQEQQEEEAYDEDLDLDTYEDDDVHGYEDITGEVDALTETLAGLSVKPLNVGQPKGLLKGVAAPVGRHFRFDEGGNAQETPVSRQRRAPTHIKFDDEGNPLSAPKPAPRWR